MKDTKEHVHISKIKVGDTVIHEGVERTVSRASMGRDDLLGVTLWGDSYKSGAAPVTRVLYAKFYAGKFVGHVTQP